MPSHRGIRKGSGVIYLDESRFRKALLAWFEHGHRDLPWRRTDDPYRIWLSEIMLQQTRSAAAIPFYEEFLRRFPNIEALARASESEVLAAWSGLGYYSRARNLHKSAQLVASTGGFPRDFTAIRQLPGVGPYTAAAVASIAFGQPHAVLDGNVLRVVARLTADPADIAAPATKKRFQEVADTLLDSRHPGNFNQAIMELGATVCLPREPMCLVCPVSEHCQALSQGVQSQLPVKIRKAAASSGSMEIAAVQRRGCILMQQRAANNSRMAGFWELPGLQDLPGLAAKQLAGEFQHTIVNHRYRVSVFSGTSPCPAGMQWVRLEKNMALPITTISRKAIALLGNR